MTVHSLTVCYKCGFRHDPDDGARWDQHHTECPGKDISLKSGVSATPPTILAPLMLCKQIVRRWVVTKQDAWIRVLLSFKAIDKNPVEGLLPIGALAAKSDPALVFDSSHLGRVVYSQLRKIEWEQARGNWRYTGRLSDKIKSDFPTFEKWLENLEKEEFKAKENNFFEAGELEWRTFPPPPGGVAFTILVLPVKIHQYPEGFDEMLGRTWIAPDSTASMSVREAYGMKYTETLTNAENLTFVLSPSYKWESMSPVKFDFYFRKENVMFKKSETFTLEREVPERPGKKIPIGAAMFGTKQDDKRAKEMDFYHNAPPMQGNRSLDDAHYAHKAPKVVNVPRWERKAIWDDKANCPIWWLDGEGEATEDWEYVDGDWRQIGGKAPAVKVEAELQKKGRYTYISINGESVKCASAKAGKQLLAIVEGLK